MKINFISLIAVLGLFSLPALGMSLGEWRWLDRERTREQKRSEQIIKGIEQLPAFNHPKPLKMLAAQFVSSCMSWKIKNLPAELKGYAKIIHEYIPHSDSNLARAIYKLSDTKNKYLPVYQEKFLKSLDNLIHPAFFESFAGRACLWNAVENHNISLAQWLLEHGINVDKGEVLLHIASMPHDNDQLAKLFIEKQADMNATLHDEDPEYDGDSVFLLAATVGNNNILRLLLDKGVKIAETHNQRTGETALMRAVRKGKYDTIDFLLQNESDVNATDAKGNSALFFAKHVDIVQFLLKYGANVNATNAKGNTALFSEKHIDIVQLLLKYGADVNATNIDGYIALALPYGFDYDQIPVIQLLLENGADARTKSGAEVLRGIANQEERLDCSNRDKFENKKNKLLALATLLLQHGTNPNAPYCENSEIYDSNYTLLHHCASTPTSNAMFELLLINHANANCRTTQGKTPLMMAVAHPDRVQLLLKYHADIHAIDNSGKSVLDYALDAFSGAGRYYYPDIKNCKDVLNLILSCNPIITYKNHARLLYLHPMATPIARIMGLTAATQPPTAQQTQEPLSQVHTFLGYVVDAALHLGS